MAATAARAEGGERGTSGGSLTTATAGQRPERDPWRRGGNQAAALGRRGGRLKPSAACRRGGGGAVGVARQPAQPEAWR